jgi:MoaA/NifB/PqqE/SkfB family radical SAM enzyme
VRPDPGAYAALALQGWGLTADRPLRGPLYAQVGISDPCDQRCVMCPYHPPEAASREDQLPIFGGEAPGMMPWTRYEALLDDLGALGTKRVDLVGRGEPLLHPRAIEMMSLAKRRGMAVSLTTNGSTLTLERARAMVEMELDWVRVSLNAGRPETYPRIHVTESPEAYLATCARVAALTADRQRAGQAKPHVTLSFTISRINAGELAAMVEVVHRTGADAGSFQHVIDPGGAEPLALGDTEYERLLKEEIPFARERARALGVNHNLKSFAETLPPGRSGGEEPVPCYVGSYFAAVLGNGRVMPCCQTKRALGSLDAGGFASIWAGEPYRAFRRAARALPAKGAELETCECDRCYFRPHNLAVDRVLHPLRTLGKEARGGLVRVEQLIRMTRLDRS